MENDDKQIVAIEDSQGIVFLGESRELDALLAEQGLAGVDVSERARQVMTAAGNALELGSQLAENSGRWVKLTKDSARYAAKFSADSGVARDAAGRIVKHLQFEKTARLVGTVANPAALANIGEMMSQMALQQSLDQINEYLEVMDRKLDAVLEDQKHRALADLGAVADGLSEARAIQDSTGHVSNTTWSKTTDHKVAAASAYQYALQKLRYATDSIAKQRNVSELRDSSRELEAELSDWLCVLATALQLHDQATILELGHVSTQEPDDFFSHREGLLVARQQRLLGVEKSLQQLSDVLLAAAERARAKQVLNPLDSPATLTNLKSCARTLDAFARAIELDAFQTDLGESARWHQAVRRRATQAGTGVRDFSVQTATKTAEGTRSVVAKAERGTAQMLAATAERLSRHAADVEESTPAASSSEGLDVDSFGGDQSVAPPSALPPTAD